jgi:nitroreductase
MELDSVITKIQDFKYSEPAADCNWDEFKKVVESRRSVRVFTDEKIPENDVRDCIKMALLAPTSSNLQQWEFHWVRTPEIRRKLITACFNQNAARTSAELIVCVGRTGTWRKHAKQMLKAFDESTLKVPKAARDYYSILAPLAYTQGPLSVLGFFRRIIIFATGLFRPVPREPMSNSDMKAWAIKSTALACENLMLAFRAKGFDTCPMEGFDAVRVRRLLKLPCDATVVMIIGAGRRAENGVYGPRIRFADAQFIKEI